MENMTKEKEHIEEIRREKFSIGEKRANPLIEDLHQAVKNLSSELYSTNVHFVKELIQVPYLVSFHLFLFHLFFRIALG